MNASGQQKTKKVINSLPQRAKDILSLDKGDLLLISLYKGYCCLRFTKLARLKITFVDPVVRLQKQQNIFHVHAPPSAVPGIPC